MEEYINLYAEYGAMGVVVALFIWNFITMSKRATTQDELLDALTKENAVQTSTISNIESIVLKMLDRWNKSDDKADRRHEAMVRELNELSDVMMEVKGSVSRINGRG
tara:strand:+ start:936 stop:1256 length:321 start_codon:yes stop_codon:yes gene_type:complete